MDLSLVRKSAPFVVILSVILMSLLFFLPTSTEDTTEEYKEISSSFFVSGSNEKPHTYQSISSGDTDNTSDSTEKVSLLEFLKGDTTDSIETITNPVSNLELNELKKYGNKVGELNNKYLPETLDEVAILNKFVTEPDNSNASNEVLSLSKRYIDLSNELLSLETPSSISLFHKDFVVVHEIVGNALKTLSENALTEENLLTYNKSPSKYIDAYLNIAQYLRASGVRFDTSEPGHLFTLPF
ncbi:hypothetical protein ACFL6I_14005 [candidate division KSB1 bacterium]